MRLRASIPGESVSRAGLCGWVGGRGGSCEWGGREGGEGWLLDTYISSMVGRSWAAAMTVP